MINKKTSQENRLLYHIVPPHGLLNDPNGLSYFKGRHHVFYQWNQHGTLHQTKSWGHVSTEDFVHWETHPPALEPKDWFDKDGCYSGSAVIHQNKMYLFYTGNVKNEAGERESYQCLASSEDGIHFIKHGPILTQPKGYTAHVRDPKVWQEEDGTWKMIVGAQTIAEKGTALLYQSKNLVDWFFLKDMGEELPPMGYMWECPDLVSLGKEDLFLYCPQGSDLDSQPNENLYQSGYMIGSLLADGTFEVQKPSFQKVDEGFEFYAPQTYKDPSGRTILFGWLGLMFPEEERTFPSIQEGYIHALTIPRIVDIQNGTFIQKPLPELKKLRAESPSIYQNQERIEGEFPSLQNEMELHLEEVEQLQIIIRNEVEITYQAPQKQVVVTRTNWSTGLKEKRIAQVAEPLRHLHIYMESSSLEIFVNEGQKVFSMRYVAQDSSRGFYLEQAKAKNSCLKIWSLNSYEGILPL